MADVLVGITMRVLRDPASGESRDALAQDWAHFFNALFPGRPWLMLPNTGEACPALAQDLGVNALVLSGGDDIGMTPLRDATETALLRWAASRNLPVLGICRGLQMLQHFFCGQLVPLAAERHLRIRHTINWTGRGWIGRKSIPTINMASCQRGWPPRWSLWPSAPKTAVWKPLVPANCPGSASCGIRNAKQYRTLRI